MLEKLIVALLSKVPVQWLDPIAVLLHKIATSIGAEEFAYQVYLVRVEWRRRFEEAMVDAVYERAKHYVIEAAGWHCASGASIRVEQVRALYGRLVDTLAADSQFCALMAELQWLPIGPKASFARISALDEAVGKYLPDLAFQEFELDLAAGFLPEKN